MLSLSSIVPYTLSLSLSQHHLHAHYLPQHTGYPSIPSPPHLNCPTTTYHCTQSILPFHLHPISTAPSLTTAHRLPFHSISTPSQLPHHLPLHRVYPYIPSPPPTTYLCTQSTLPFHLHPISTDHYLPLHTVYPYIPSPPPITYHYTPSTLPFHLPPSQLPHH